MKESNFVASTIKYKGLIYMAMALLVAFGIWGLLKINKDELPPFEIREGLVVGVYPGANVREVEQQLTKPLETTLFSIPQVDRGATKSYSKDGMSYIYVSLTVGADEAFEAWEKIRTALSAKKATLPTGVLAVAVLDDFSSVSSMLISLESPDKDYSEMKEYADELCSELRRIDDLAYAKLVGDRAEQISVTIDPERLSAYGLSTSQLLLDYKTAGMQILTGSYETTYANSPLHVGSLLSSEAQVAEKIVYSDLQGNVLRLRDIAKIERCYQEPSSIVKYNGRTALLISVEMRNGHDIVSFGDQVYAVLDAFEEELPDSVTLTRITDQPRVVRESVWSFVRDLCISMLVVILVMLLLFPLRSALIAGIGVPICTAVALAVMWLSGMNLNTVTLAALIVVLGMIVDDAIVTMDGYMDYLRRGRGRLEAASLSTRELFIPMTVSTFAIAFMMFPTLFTISGYLGDFVKDFPWVVLIALVCSLVYAVVIVPSLEVKYIRSAQSDGRFARIQSKFFALIQDGYERLEGICFKHPYMTLGCGAATILLGVYMFTFLNVQMMPMAERPCFAVEVYLDSSSGLSSTEAVCDSLQVLLMQDERVSSVTEFIGSSSPRFQATYAPKLPGKNFGQLIVNTISSEATEEVLREVGGFYENYFPEAFIRFKQIDYQAVTAPVELIFKGSTISEMKPYADSLKAFMQEQTDLLTWVHSDVDDCTAVINVDLDPEQAARLGVNKTLLSVSLAGTFRGTPIGSIWEGDKEIPITVYSCDVNSDMSYETIGNQMISTLGVSVPLRQVASISPSWEYEQIPHLGGEQTISVMADMVAGRSQPESMAVTEEFLSGMELPEGISIKRAGLSSANEKVMPEIALCFVIAVAILLIFMLLHFKKMSLAVMTIVISLLCLFGASFGLWLFGYDFGLTSVLGIISLIGITVKNGIIIFEEAEILRFEHGLAVREAAFEAGRRRMRPIFLASCTTALGVIPMIISRSALWSPMGVSICFGIIFSIVLTVLIMPVSYWQVFKNASNKEVDYEK